MDGTDATAKDRYRETHMQPITLYIPREKLEALQDLATAAGLKPGVLMRNILCDWAVEPPEDVLTAANGLEPEDEYLKRTGNRDRLLR